MELKSFSKDQSEGSAACQGQVTPTESICLGLRESGRHQLEEGPSPMSPNGFLEVMGGRTGVLIEKAMVYPKRGSRVLDIAMVRGPRARF